MAGLQNKVTQWSWHFWVLTGGTAAINSFTINNIAGMDRNLGALSNATGNDNALGLLYEWGRKDPFPGGLSKSSNTRKSLYNFAGNTISTTQTSSTAIVSTTIQNPTNFYSSNYDWHPTGNDNLWGNTSGAKTVFDPCPSGWRIPANNTMWSDWGTLNFLWNLTNLGCTHLASTAWYPGGGYYSTPNGTLTNVGATGYYWTRTPSTSLGNRTAKGLTFTTILVNNNADANRANGLSVRCVKE